MMDIYELRALTLFLETYMNYWITILLSIIYDIVMGYVLKDIDARLESSQP